MLAAYHAGKPARTPVCLGTSTRFFMFNNPGANPAGVEFKEYFENPDLMFDLQLQFQRWRQFNLLQDDELGLPEKWTVRVDFQNFHEAAYFGCPIEFMPGQVPDARSAFADAPEKVMEHGIPDPFGGVMARARRYYEHFKNRAAAETFLERPIEVAPGFIFPEGPFTLACGLFGTDVACVMMIEEPDRYRALLDFLVTSMIGRMKAWRELCGVPADTNFWYADDSIAMISTEMFREFVLPDHRRMCEVFDNGKPRSIHLCGDATRHFPMLQKELNVQSFDTGFPVDFGAVRRALGPGAEILGGPHVELLLSATPGQVREEVRRIMESGILEGGKFILREGNNLAPGTPLENTEAMYHAGREFGVRG